jgi:hypothetical protein
VKEECACACGGGWGGICFRERKGVCSLWSDSCRVSEMPWGEEMAVTVELRSTEATLEAIR